MAIHIDTSVYLIGGGAVLKSQFLSMYDGSDLFAVDAGANNLENWGIVPKGIIGDLDSLRNRQEWEKKTNIIEISDQSSTDLEKCLDYIIAPQYLCFGFLEKRFDHTLEILHVMCKYNDRCLLFFSSHDVIFRIPKQWNITLPQGTRISLYPLEKTGSIEGKGFAFDPTGLTMEQGSIIGTSNKSSAKTVSLRYDKGMLLGIVPVQHFKNVQKSLCTSEAV